jgi:uncharacterized protein
MIEHPAHKLPITTGAADPWRIQPQLMRVVLRIVRMAAAALQSLALIAPAFAAGEAAGSDAALSKKQHAYTNRLIDSNDPYLLLHAHNPVDWYPWGPEAFAKAKRENRPIFVSIGYSTCYWCHVAERMIYSNPEIAKLMNEWFINVKVDREQRPDVDSIYMLATELMTGHGGWPNNVFLTPDLKPFYAGSYFPPSDDSFGRPGFPKILKSLHEAWTDHRQDVERQAGAIYAEILKAQDRPKVSMLTPSDPKDWLAQARELFLQGYDRDHGGLADGPTKFPHEPILDLLLADFAKTREPKLGEALTRTLDAMALGGIYDHLGGGFHRYSTESTWSIPHFEKMLYDNAQLLGIYAQAYRVTGIALYRQVAVQTAAYLSRQMMAPTGGFYAAEDAEVAGREGASYVWRRGEILSVLGAAGAVDFFKVYTLTPMPEPTGDELSEDKQPGVLRVRTPLVETLRRVRTKDIGEALAALVPARSKLLAARNQRPQPARDDKIIVAWNGMAIDALARSAVILNEPEYARFAAQAGEQIWKLAYQPAKRELRHEVFNGRAQTDGYLDDYALLGVGFLSLAEATHDPVWRDRASELARAMLRHFEQGGALITTLAAKDLLVAPLEQGDNTAPSGTSAAVQLLSHLRVATADAGFGQAAARALAPLSGEVQKYPLLWASAVAAVNQYPLQQASEARTGSMPAAGNLPGQVPSSADQVRASASAASRVDRDEITVTIAVADGYHINANPASFDYLIPTRLSFGGVKGLQVDYPKPTVFKPRFASEGLKVYQGTVTLRATAPKGATTRGVAVNPTLDVQACNDEICLPPATLPLHIERR